VTFLADDLLEGREAGTRGHEIAAAIIASQFDQLGVKPAGRDGSYFERSRCWTRSSRERLRRSC
jgi:hypothetical protein